MGPAHPWDWALRFALGLVALGLALAVSAKLADWRDLHRIRRRWRFEMDAPAAYPLDCDPWITPEEDPVQRILLTLHNTERTARGLPALTLDVTLIRAAAVIAVDNAERDRMSHQAADGSWPWHRAERCGFSGVEVAENLCRQPFTPGHNTRTPEWAVEGWMASPGHRANLLGDSNRVGFAMRDAASRNRYWVAVYGRVPS